MNLLLKGKKEAFQRLKDGDTHSTCGCGNTLTKKDGHKFAWPIKKLKDIGWLIRIQCSICGGKTDLDGLKGCIKEKTYWYCYQSNPICLYCAHQLNLDDDSYGRL